MRNIFISIALAVVFAAPAFAEEGAAPPAEPTPISAEAPTTSIVAARGQMVVAANGARIGRVSRLADDGSPQVIFEGKVVTVPLATLSVVDGRLVSTLSPAEIAAL